MHKEKYVDTHKSIIFFLSYNIIYSSPCRNTSVQPIRKYLKTCTKF